MQTICIDYNQHFTRSADESWKKRCFSCWRDWKKRQESEFVAIDFDQASEIRELKRQNRALTRELKKTWIELEREHRRAALLNIMDGLTQSASTIDQQRVKQLIRLCHPDKHNGSKAANDATTWLLEQREESRR